MMRDKILRSIPAIRKNPSTAHPVCLHCEGACYYADDAYHCPNCFAKYTTLPLLVSYGAHLLNDNVESLPEPDAELIGDAAVTLAHLFYVTGYREGLGIKVDVLLRVLEALI